MSNKKIKKLALEKLGNSIISDNHVYFAFVIRIALTIIVFISLAIAYLNYKQLLMNKVSAIIVIVGMIISLKIPYIPFFYSYDRKMLQISKSPNDNNFSFSDFIYYYKNKTLSIIGVDLLKTMFLYLWLFTIVGVFIKIYSYSMSEYIKIEYPHLSANDCITESRRIMNGNKFKLFCLHLSFIGWLLLSIITLGALYPFVFTYMNMSEVEFYNSIKNNNNLSENNIVNENGVEENINNCNIENMDNIYTSDDKDINKYTLKNKTLIFIITIVLSISSFVGFNYWNNKMQRNYYNKLIDFEVVKHNLFVDIFFIDVRRTDGKGFSKRITFRLY